MEIKKRDRAGFIACYILAFTSLAAAIYHIQLLLPLLNNGNRTTAIVIDIYRGARSGKWAVYQFNTENGSQQIARDKILMFIIQIKKGERVSVIYDPVNPDTVTADLGKWIWQGPVIFLFGFVFLATLGILILRYNPEKS